MPYFLEKTFWNLNTIGIIKTKDTLNWLNVFYIMRWSWFIGRIVSFLAWVTNISQTLYAQFPLLWTILKALETLNAWSFCRLITTMISQRLQLFILACSVLDLTAVNHGSQWGDGSLLFSVEIQQIIDSRACTIIAFSCVSKNEPPIDNSKFMNNIWTYKIREPREKIA